MLSFKIGELQLFLEKMTVPSAIFPGESQYVYPPRYRMSSLQVFEHSISIRASATDVEQCLTRQDLMHRWLNPALRCEPIGDWNTDLGGKSRFLIQIPL